MSWGGLISRAELRCGVRVLALRPGAGRRSFSLARGELVDRVEVGEHIDPSLVGLGSQAVQGVELPLTKDQWLQDLFDVDR